jgi:hypothetical protein
MDPINKARKDINKARKDIERVIAALDPVLKTVPTWFKVDLLAYSSVAELKAAVEKERLRHIDEVTKWVCKKSEKSFSRIFRTLPSGLFGSSITLADREELFNDIYGDLVANLQARNLHVAFADDGYVYFTKIAGAPVSVKRRIH